MAYSMYEHSLMKTEKHVQYYPEEYDYAGQNYNQSLVQSPRAARKLKKAHPSMTYENERKCPIYIHQFNRSPYSSIYANYSSTHEPNLNIQHKSSKPKSKSQNSKLVLDKLEETYWATWKPNKNSPTKNTKTPRFGYEKQKFETFRDNAAQGLIKYFEMSDFPSTSASATDEVEAGNTYKQFETTTQEIQTDDLYPVSFSVSEHSNETALRVVEAPSSTGTVRVSASREAALENQRKSDEDEPIDEENRANAVENELIEEFRKAEYAEITSDENLGASIDNIGGQNVDKKLLNHTDSFIITKKKQNVVKEYLQQPRCIKLYKKTVSSYLKGGSYPLKPCLKKETSSKGNFGLGAPGSPLFVNGSSFNKKKF